MPTMTARLAFYKASKSSLNPCNDQKRIWGASLMVHNKRTVKRSVHCSKDDEIHLLLGHNQCRRSFSTLTQRKDDFMCPGLNNSSALLSTTAKSLAEYVANRVHHNGDDQVLCCPRVSSSDSSVLSDSVVPGTSPRSLLHLVQMSGLFKDSKTFVDMKLKNEPELVQAEFDELVLRLQGEEPTKELMQQFVEQNFTLEDQLEPHMPMDWKPCISLTSRLGNEDLRKFAHSLHSIWPNLCRIVKKEVAIRPELYTLLYLPKPVIVPGGRFREIYYWDSYWILRGLLVSEMPETARGMLENLVHLVQLFGHVPNGGRTYYVNRSQPPLLVIMVNDYVQATGDFEFLRQNLKHLLTEYEYWLREHLVTLEINSKSYTLARFNCNETGPRPESYREDYEMSLSLSACEAREEFFKELKTVAETGWDFSSRWMDHIDDDTNNAVGYDLTSSIARNILPVDLNAFMEYNARNLARLVALASPADIFEENNIDDSDEMESKRLKLALRLEREAEMFREGLDQVLWNEKIGCWCDFDHAQKRSRPSFTPSNLVPLYTLSSLAPWQASMAIDYLERQPEFPGGVPASLVSSGEQWDWPNCWPPSEHMLVLGLNRFGDEKARNLARKIATKRVRASQILMQRRGHMFEKYDAREQGMEGFGGEYQVQVGFGWTNGVVLDFIDIYGDDLVQEENDEENENENNEENVDKEKMQKEMLGKHDHLD